MKKLIFIILLVIAAIVTFFFGGQMGITALERNAPTIAISQVKDGGSSISVEFKVADSESGLGKLKAQAVQNDKTIDIADKSYESFADTDTIVVSLIKFNELKEGPAKIKVSLEDSSIWGNSSTQELDLLIDYSPPKLQLLSLQHVAAQGGVEFVIYKASDSNLKRQGVVVGDHFFPGYKLNQTGLETEVNPEYYGSLFALPLGYDRSKSPLEIQAEDEAGNVTKLVLNFRIEPKAQNAVDMKLSDDFLARKNPELYPGFQRMSAQKSIEIPAKEGDVTDEVWKFMLVNKNYRGMLDDRLKEIAVSSTRPRLWKETFIKPMPSATSSTFGEKRSYKYNDTPAGGSVHNGLDLASVQADAVFSANDGVVVLSEEFGIYGNAIMIDHGLGLFSLYGHLSSLGVKVDDKVTKGQEIGRSGQTGLAGGDHLHFEFRVRDVPVTPIEWWDPKWIKDNIDGKLAEVTP